MATKYWIGGTASNEGNWGTAGNWSDAAVPVTGDTVFVDARGGANHVVTGLGQSGVTLSRLVVVQGSPNVGTITTPLAISATVLDVNVPPTDGSSPAAAQTVNVNVGANVTTATVYGSHNTGASGVEPVTIKGSHASNVLRVRDGIVGVATALPGDTATFASIFVGGDGTSVRVSSGVTLTSLSQTGGNCRIECAATTINQDRGTLRTEGGGGYTTVNVSGVAVLNSTGTITTLNVEPTGTADFSDSVASRTVTNAFVSGAGVLNANLPVIAGSNHPVTFTNGVDCLRGANSGQVDFGGDITVTASAV